MSSAFSSGRGGGERRRRARVLAFDLQHDIAERPPQRADDVADLAGKGGIGDFGRGLRGKSRLLRIRKGRGLEPDRLCRRADRRSRPDLGSERGRGGLVADHDLGDGAQIGSGIFGTLRGEGSGNLGRGRCRLGRDAGRVHHGIAHDPALGHAVLRDVASVESGEIGIGRRGARCKRLAGHEADLPGALFEQQAGIRQRQSARHLRSAAGRADQLTEQDLVADLGADLRIALADLAQRGIVFLLAELAVQPGQARVAGDGGVDRLLAHDDALRLGELPDRGGIDEIIDRGIEAAPGDELRHVERRLLLAIAVQVLLGRGAHVGDGDRGLADLRCDIRLGDRAVGAARARPVLQHERQAEQGDEGKGKPGTQRVRDHAANETHHGRVGRSVVAKRGWCAALGGWPGRIKSAAPHLCAARGAVSRVGRDKA